MTEMEQRAAVVLEARSWVGTPYHHNAGKKGVGTDCAQILVGVWSNVGLIEHFEPGFYTHDWHLHRNEERYLAKVEEFCRRVDDSDASLKERGAGFFARPGDILMWRVGRTFSHAAIVSSWPRIIHANNSAFRVEEVSVRGTPIEKYKMRVYSFWGKQA